LLVGRYFMELVFTKYWVSMVQADLFF